MDADGRKRGFGFVTMASSEAAKAAEVALRTADLRSRRLVVNLAHPKGDRPAGSGGGGGFGGPAPFSSSFGGGGGGGGPPKKGFEQPRKRSFEDGGGAAPGAGRKKAKERGGANKFNYPVGDDDE
jgi:RNA recognition motif-containing protein